MVKSNQPYDRRPKERIVLGLGLDNDDGHIRMTRTEHFHLIGGSQETHEQMQEQVIKFNEKLGARGRTFPEITRQEFVDLAHEVGMTVAPDDFVKRRPGKGPAS